MQIRFHSNIFPPPPVYLYICFSSFTLFLSACLFLSSNLYFASVSSPRNFSVDRTSFLGPPLNPSIFSRLRYPILFQLALLLFSHIQPYQLWLATSFLAYCLFDSAVYFILPFQLSYVSTCFKWVHMPNSGRGGGGG